MIHVTATSLWTDTARLHESLAGILDLMKSRGKRDCRVVRGFGAVVIANTCQFFGGFQQFAVTVNIDQHGGSLAVVINDERFVS